MLLLVKILGKIEPFAWLGTLICISAICHLSRTEPLERKIIYNLNNYFDDLNQENTTANIIAKNNRRRNIGEIVMKNKIDIFKTKNKNKLFLRKLVNKSFCRKIRYKFENYQGAKLSRIFNLEIKKINRLSIGIIVAICFPLVTNLIAYFGYKKGENDSTNKEFAYKVLFYTILGLLTNLILLIILAVIYKKVI